MNEKIENKDNEYKLDKLYYDTTYQKRYYTKHNTKMRLSFESRYMRYKEVIKKTTKEYYDNNKEKCIAENRLYYLRHKEAIEERKKKWRQARMAKSKYQNLLLIILALEVVSKW
jgi:hypothetical protein